MATIMHFDIAADDPERVKIKLSLPISLISKNK